MPRSSSRDMAVRVEAGILQGFGDGGRGQRHGARDVRPVLHLHPDLLIEFGGHFARNLHGESGRIEAGDAFHPAHAVARGLPEIFPPNAVGTDRADSRNHNASHGSLLLVQPSV